MKRVLKIVGGGKEKIIEHDYDCPLRDVDDHYCGHPDSECLYCTLGDRIGDSCPLPDATEAPADVWPDDGNHRLGPNGERLIAVDGWKCCLCFYQKLDCFKVPCKQSEREDNRFIHWELAGDRK